jgi:hypothetical protein
MRNFLRNWLSRYSGSMIHMCFLSRQYRGLRNPLDIGKNEKSWKRRLSVCEMSSQALRFSTVISCQYNTVIDIYDSRNAEYNGKVKVLARLFCIIYIQLRLLFICAGAEFPKVKVNLLKFYMRINNQCKHKVLPYILLRRCNIFMLYLI